jgi:hypothetical protein
MTVACLRAVIHDKGGLAPPIHVLDALSGTGLRAIRMALEGEWLSIVLPICTRPISQTWCIQVSQEHMHTWTESQPKTERAEKTPPSSIRSARCE